MADDPNPPPPDQAPEGGEAMPPKAACVAHVAANPGPAWDVLIAQDREIGRLRAALREVDRLCPHPGGPGQIARDALRVDH